MSSGVAGWIVNLFTIRGHSLPDSHSRNLQQIPQGLILPSPQVSTVVPESRLTVVVRHPVDSVVAASLARRFGRESGLSAASSAEVALVVSELATNLVRHTRQGGTVELWREDAWLCIRALDRGPGMTEPERLFAGREGRPGPLPGESLGEGGAAVRRLTDEVRVSNREGGGLEVFARKRMTREARRTW
ncbi:ATPase [Myxococcus stipitatus DSM 14675]|uniref:ATPase n=1 Tax=Myxococcus stipitatus (strain DSM 14675 / JCM 12634 / Mx s8) TaxID=1278073 RepID=L7U6J1_MYXSD|nr:ATPase [Myxococcus stipitatus DSM 14675]